MKKRMTLTEHLDEKTMALHVLDAPEVSHRRREIARHLLQCKGCGALHREISKYYEEFNKLERTTEAPGLMLYAPERTLRTQVFRDAVSAPPMKQTLPQRFVASFSRYPMGWSAGFVAAALAAVLLVPRYIRNDVNPEYARAKEEFLVVYDKSGRELWRKHVGSGFDAAQHARYFRSVPAENLVAKVDVDADGVNEVVAVFGWKGSPTRTADKNLDNKVICYNADGSVRWRYELHRTVKFGRELFPDNYWFGFLLAGDYDKDGNVELYAHASVLEWYPSVLMRLDPKSGRVISEFWQPGGFSYSAVKDLDGDGIQELIFGGGNVSFGNAVLAIFDPRFVDGFAPTSARFEPQEKRPAAPKYYILIPELDFGQLKVRFFETQWLQIGQDNFIEIGVSTPKFLATVHFTFDASMKCLGAKASSDFPGQYAKLLAEGKLTRPLNDKYYEDLRQGVRYWDGEKFVKEPTINKRYVEALATIKKKKPEIIETK